MVFLTESPQRFLIFYSLSWRRIILWVYKICPLYLLLWNPRLSDSQYKIHKKLTKMKLVNKFLILQPQDKELQVCGEDWLQAGFRIWKSEAELWWCPLSSERAPEGSEADGCLLTQGGRKVRQINGQSDHNNGSANFLKDSEHTIDTSHSHSCCLFYLQRCKVLNQTDFSLRLDH